MSAPTGRYNAHHQSRQHNAKRMTVNYFGNGWAAAVVAVLLLAGGGAGLVVWGQFGAERSAYGRPAAPRAPTTVGTPAPGTAMSPAADAADPATPAKRVDTDVVLPRYAAADVDLPRPTVVLNRADGATGDFDLYHDYGRMPDAVQVVSPPNVHMYTGGAMKYAYQACVSDLTRSALQWYPAYTGFGGFCFRTSSGRVAFATISRSREDFAFVMRVVVWDAE